MKDTRPIIARYECTMTSQSSLHFQGEIVGSVLTGLVGVLLGILVIVLCIRRNRLSNKRPQNIPAVYFENRKSDEVGELSVNINMQPVDNRLQLSPDSSLPRDSLFLDFGHVHRRNSTSSHKSSKSFKSIRLKSKRKENKKPSYLNRPSKLMTLMRQAFPKGGSRPPTMEVKTDERQVNETVENVFIVNQTDDPVVVYSRCAVEKQSTQAETYSGKEHGHQENNTASTTRQSNDELSRTDHDYQDPGQNIDAIEKEDTSLEKHRANGRYDSGIQSDTGSLEVRVNSFEEYIF